MYLNFIFLNDIKFLSANNAMATSNNIDKLISTQKLNGFITKMTNHNSIEIINENIIILFFLSNFSKAFPPFYNKEDKSIDKIKRIPN